MAASTVRQNTFTKGKRQNDLRQCHVLSALDMFVLSYWTRARCPYAHDPSTPFRTTGLGQQMPSQAARTRSTPSVPLAHTGEGRTRTGNPAVRTRNEPRNRSGGTGRAVATVAKTLPSPAFLSRAPAVKIKGGRAAGSGPSCVPLASSGERRGAADKRGRTRNVFGAARALWQDTKRDQSVSCCRGPVVTGHGPAADRYFHHFPPGLVRAFFCEEKNKARRWC